MRILTPSALFFPLLLAAASWAQAQQPSAAREPTAPALAALPWPSDRILTDAPAPGEVWAATGAWKAGFDHRGATFVPFLGSDVPSRPVTMALRAARCGGVALRIDAAEPVLNDQRVAFARGDVIEYFDLRREGIEQGFVLPWLPNRGTLELDVVVDTALAVHADAHGHTFLAPEGGVRYGSAVVFDDAGRSQPIEAAWIGDALRLTVPATFLAQARLPLCVDPLLSPVQTSPALPKAMSAADLAYDHSLGRFFACYEHAFSATDHDVYVLTLDQQMQIISTLTIDFTSTWWARPRIATLEAHDVVRVVAETSPNGVAPFGIKSRAFPAGATTVSSTVENYSLLSSIDQRDPDIGGDASPNGPSRFLVAWSAQWQSNADYIAFQLVAADGQIQGPASLYVGIVRSRRPAISKTCGDVLSGQTGWAITFRREVQGAADGWLSVSLIRRDGVVIDPSGPYQNFATLGASTANTGSEWDVSSPTSHALGHTFLCAEVRVDAASGRGVLYGHAFDFAGNVLAGDALLAAGTVDRRRPAVDSDGCRFVLANDNVYSATDRDVRVATVALIAGQVVPHDAAVASLAFDIDTGPALCAMRGHGLNDYGLAWIHQANGTWSMQRQRYDGVAAGAAFAGRTTGCGNLLIFAFGSSALGESFVVDLGGATGLAGFLAGTPVNVPIGSCPGCVLGANGPLFVGAPFAIQVPAQPSLVGAVVSFQGVQLLPGGAPCLGQFELSDTIDVTIR